MYDTYDFEGTGECFGCMAEGPSECPNHGTTEASEEDDDA